MLTSKLTQYMQTTHRITHTKHNTQPPRCQQPTHVTDTPHHVTAPFHVTPRENFSPSFTATQRFATVNNEDADALDDGQMVVDVYFWVALSSFTNCLCFTLPSPRFFQLPRHAVFCPPPS